MIYVQAEVSMADVADAMQDAGDLADFLNKLGGLWLDNEWLEKVKLSLSDEAKAMLIKLTQK